MKINTNNISRAEMREQIMEARRQGMFEGLLAGKSEGLASGRAEGRREGKKNGMEILEFTMVGNSAVFVDLREPIL